MSKVIPVGISSSSCGYCKASGETSVNEGLIAASLTVQEYQWFLDEFLETLTSLRSRFTWSMEASVFDEEGFQVYQKYQNRVHGDDLDSLIGENYEQFLCDSPLKKRAIPGLSDPILGMRLWYGTWHIHYRVDGSLRAVSVIDILPTCVSSVYLYYDPDYDADLSWGTISALLEIGLVRRISEVCPELKYYYLGYYLEDCPKLAYKARFRPSEFLDPITLDWLKE